MGPAFGWGQQGNQQTDHSTPFLPIGVPIGVNPNNPNNIDTNPKKECWKTANASSTVWLNDPNPKRRFRLKNTRTLTNTNAQ